jgi:hypothetical protein
MKSAVPGLGHVGAMRTCDPVTGQSASPQLGAPGVLNLKHKAWRRARP